MEVGATGAVPYEEPVAPTAEVESGKGQSAEAFGIEEELLVPVVFKIGELGGEVPSGNDDDPVPVGPAREA